MDHLDGVCLVFPASFPPDVSLKEKLLDNFGEVFGRTRVLMLATFADMNDSQLLASAAELKIFKFNNSALYAAADTATDTATLDTTSQLDLGSKFWEVGQAFLEHFFRHFPMTSSAGITLTEEVASVF